MNPYPKYISVTYYQLFSSQSNYLPSMELSNKSRQLFIYFSILQILEISQEKQSDVTSLKRYVQGELPQILFFSLYTLTMSKNIFQTECMNVITLTNKNGNIGYGEEDFLHYLVTYGSDPDSGLPMLNVPGGDGRTNLMVNIF